MKLKLHKFDMSKIASDATIMVVGKRRTGKSTLIRDIMRSMAGKVDFGIAMCGSEDTTKAMSEYIPQSCIYDDYSAPALDVLLRVQQKGVAAGTCKPVYLVMDDTMYDKQTLKSKNMRMLFMNGRHRKIFFLCAVQYLMDIPPDIRTNVDYLFVLKENVLSNREKLHKQFFGMFAEYKDFSVVMNSCTSGFQCMVLDNTARSNDPSDCVFWYQADAAGPDFRVGSPGVWALHAKYGSSSQKTLGGGGERRLFGEDGGEEEAAARDDDDDDDDDEEDGTASVCKSTPGVAQRIAAEKRRKKRELKSSDENASRVRAVQQCGVKHSREAQS
jgi:hypothetical protein